MIPKFIRFKDNVFSINNIDYIVLKDSDILKNRKNNECYVVTNIDIRKIVEYNKKYKLEDMEEFLSGYDIVTIEDKVHKDIYSINVENITHFDRDVRSVLRIHFKGGNVIYIFIDKEKDVEDILEKLTEWE